MKYFYIPNLQWDPTHIYTRRVLTEVLLPGYPIQGKKIHMAIMYLYEHYAHYPNVIVITEENPSTITIWVLRNSTLPRIPIKIDNFYIHIGYL